MSRLVFPLPPVRHFPALRAPTSQLNHRLFNSSVLSPSDLNQLPSRRVLRRAAQLPRQSNPSAIKSPRRRAAAVAAAAAAAPRPRTAEVSPKRQWGRAARRTRRTEPRISTSSGFPSRRMGQRQKVRIASGLQNSKHRPSVAVPHRNLSEHPVQLSNHFRCDNVQVNHDRKQRAHAGGDQVGHDEARTRGLARELHALPAAAGQR